MSDAVLQVFILSYNRREYLEKCLYSFLQQSFQQVEILVLDNKSDFDVEELVAKMHSPKIQVIVNESNIGSFGNFTKAINLASKKYIMIFHDDDCISPNLIATQIELFDKYESTGFIVTGVNLVSEFDQMTNFGESKTTTFHYYPNKGDILDVYYSGKLLGFGSIMYKTELIKNIQPEPAKYAQVIDRAYMLNLSMHSPLIVLDYPNYNALQHDQQDSFDRKWDFKYDINLMNLYYGSSDKANKKYLNWNISVSCAELFSLRRPLPSLNLTIQQIQFKSKSDLMIFLICIPYFFIRSRILYFIKRNVPFIYLFLVSLKKRLK